MIPCVADFPILYHFIVFISHLRPLQSWFHIFFLSNLTTFVRHPHPIQSFFQLTYSHYLDNYGKKYSEFASISLLYVRSEVLELVLIFINFFKFWENWITSVNNFDIIKWSIRHSFLLSSCSYLHDVQPNPFLFEVMYLSAQPEKNTSTLFVFISLLLIKF